MHCGDQEVDKKVEAKLNDFCTFIERKPAELHQAGTCTHLPGGLATSSCWSHPTQHETHADCADLKTNIGRAAIMALLAYGSVPGPFTHTLRELGRHHQALIGIAMCPACLAWPCLSCLAGCLQLSLSFFELRKKQAWFGTQDERLYWEQW